MSDVQDNALQLHDIEKEAVVRQIVEKTKFRALIWDYLGGGMFSSQYPHRDRAEAGDTIWTYYVVRNQVGQASFKFTFEVTKDAQVSLTVVDGPMPASERDSQVKNLWHLVEMLTLELNTKAEEALRAAHAILPPVCPGS